MQTRERQREPCLLPLWPSLSCVVKHQFGCLFDFLCCGDRKLGHVPINSAWWGLSVVLTLGWLFSRPKEILEGSECWTENLVYHQTWRQTDAIHFLPSVQTRGDLSIFSVEIIRYSLYLQLKRLSGLMLGGNSEASATLRSQTSAAKGVAVIVFLFVISWIPLYTLNTVVFFCSSCHESIPPVRVSQQDELRSSPATQQRLFPSIGKILCPGFTRKITVNRPVQCHGKVHISEIHSQQTSLVVIPCGAIPSRFLILCIGT